MGADVSVGSRESARKWTACLCVHHGARMEQHRAASQEWHLHCGLGEESSVVRKETAAKIVNKGSGGGRGEFERWSWELGVRGGGGTSRRAVSSEFRVG